MPMSSRASVRRRLITDADLEAVAGLLSGGFRLRPKSYWRRGLARLADRAVPDGYPRFGYLIESDGRVVGVLLTIFSAIESGGMPTIRCNLSSWYVEPAFRGHATLLLSYALKDRSVTYINVSPAPNTWSTIAVQGFRPYGTGKRLVVPALSRSAETVRIARIGEAGPSANAMLPRAERDVLDDHSRWGCLSLVVQEDDGCHPFVLARHRVWHRLVPTMHLVYCRDIADFTRFAGPLGRYLLIRGMPSVLVDATATTERLVGRAIGRDRSRYVRGPCPPAPGDLAYTEGVFFGP